MTTEAMDRSSSPSAINALAEFNRPDSMIPPTPAIIPDNA